MTTKRWECKETEMKAIRSRQGEIRSKPPPQKLPKIQGTPCACARRCLLARRAARRLGGVASQGGSLGGGRSSVVGLWGLGGGRGVNGSARVGRGNPVVGGEGHGNNVDAGRDGRVGRAQRRGGCGTGWERQHGGRGVRRGRDGTGGTHGERARAANEGSMRTRRQYSESSSSLPSSPAASPPSSSDPPPSDRYSSFAVASSSFVAASAAAISPVSPSMSASFARASFSRCCCLFFPISLVRNLSAHEGMHPSTTALATHLQAVLAFALTNPSAFSSLPLGLELATAPTWDVE
ncbi:hypothetical protein B0H14DRAFT_2582559 [Mycena olivaceomarginata]|nr:hypothetical protein B0H14DRAFT_2582559 [Mycena olivaceomarginata]